MCKDQIKLRETFRYDFALSRGFSKDLYLPKKYLKIQVWISRSVLLEDHGSFSFLELFASPGMLEI